MPRRKARVARAAPTARRRATRRAARREGPQGESTTTESTTAQPTAVVLEAAATGIVPLAVPEPREEIPGGEDEKMRVGDPDVSPLQNEYAGEEVPGASTPTPDQNQVDEIGRAYGVEQEDDGSLRTSSELLDRRDRKRQD
jgi:hypothetical protein